MSHPSPLYRRGLKSFLSLGWLIVLAGSLSLAGSLAAQTVTFAQFLQSNPGNPVTLINNGLSVGGAVTLSASVGVDFRYFVPGLPPELTGFQNATLTMSLTSSTPATTSGGNITQAFPNVATITIIRNQPYNGSTNLLTVTFTGFDLSGTAGGSGASGSASSANGTVTYSSDFLSFANSTERDFALSFSSVNPNLSIAANNLLNSFTAAFGGTFSANPIPIVTVPEMNPSAILGLIVAAAAAAEFGRQRLRRRAAVAAPAKDDEPALV